MIFLLTYLLINFNITQYYYFYFLVDYMIIEWSVENFLSFLDEQKISCEATTDSSLRDSNVFEVGDKGIDGVVKSLAILGDNGSGKSNLLNALSYLQAVVSHGLQFGGTEDYSTDFHHLEKISAKDAFLKVELVALVNEIKYHYGVSITCHGTVEREFLNTYLAFKPQKWFERHYDSESGKYVYETCIKLKGDKSVWEKSTDYNELFLSNAAKLSSKQLLPFYDWILNKLVFLRQDSLHQVAEKLRRSGDYKGISKVCRFLSLPFSEGTDETLIITFKKFSIIYGYESDATLKLWDFAILLLDVIRHGKVLVADCFLDELHPITVRKILELFHNPAINTKKSQLFFTTHMVNLLDQKLLRRDQIWFVEKNYELTPETGMGASQLHRLTEFSPRKTDNIERNYLAGDYGAIPKQGDISGLIGCF